MDRKEFLGYGAAALIGRALPGSSADRMSEEPPSSGSAQRGHWQEMVREAVAYRKLDVHNHVDRNTRTPSNIDESCRRVGITRTAVSVVRASTPQQMRENNDLVLEAMRARPGRIMGSCTVNPGWQAEALEEIDRCVEGGMVMVGELYDEYKINNPVWFPIIERCIDHKIPILMHGASLLGHWRPEYWRYGDNPLSTSTAADFVEVAERYPEAMLIYGHIGGGGDWEYACKVLSESPTLYAEISGSVADARMVDLAVDMLGTERILFGTDVNYENAVGKVMHAELSREQRERIFFDNFNELLREAGNHVD